MYTVKTKITNSSIHGKGYFAVEDISTGTVVYFYGADDIPYNKQEFEFLDEAKKKELLEFAVEDEFGNWVLTKTGPYTNHSCDANILSLYVDGIYFDISVKDIKKDDEITIDYGMFYSSVKWSMDCKCGADVCRKHVGFGIDVSGETEVLWFNRLRGAVKAMNQVKQPLFELNDLKAKNLVKAIQSKTNTMVGKFVKFPLISA